MFEVVSGEGVGGLFWVCKGGGGVILGCVLGGRVVGRGFGDGVWCEGEGIFLGGRLGA